MCTSDSTHITVWLRPLSGRLLVAEGWELRLWILCTQSTSFRGIRLSASWGHLLEVLSKADCTCFCTVSTFLVSSSMANGLGEWTRSCPNKPPSSLRWHGWKSSHYFGPCYGLLKDVRLSALPFKAWSMHSLSRSQKNNAGHHYADIQVTIHFLLHPHRSSTVEPRKPPR